MISVALCTYNGEEFLEEQLESILRQTIRPSEIVIGDDGSVDRTIRIIESYTPKFLDAGVKVVYLPGGEKPGFVQNFERTMKATSGGIIFLSDQDDVWDSRRIEFTLQVFSDHPDCLLVHSDAQLVDSKGKSLDKSLFQALSYGIKRQQVAINGKSFEELLKRNVVTGATAAIRRELIGLSSPFVSSWIHDEWLGINAAALGGYFVTDRKLISYRQHPNNVVGVKSWSIRSSIAYYFASRNGRHKQLVDRGIALLKHSQSRNWDSNLLKLVEKKLEFEQKRQQFSDFRLLRFPEICLLALKGGYRQFCFRP
jgi:glycosyltransferase involved in cell wall biosynthesis